jgi:HEAT repeats
LVRKGATEDMSEVNTRKKWYTPASLAERANQGFLGVIRSTGMALRQVEHGTTSGVYKVKGLVKREASSPAQPSPAPRFTGGQPSFSPAPRPAVALGTSGRLQEEAKVSSPQAQPPDEPAAPAGFFARVVAAAATVAAPAVAAVRGDSSEDKPRAQAPAEVAAAPKSERIAPQPSQSSPQARGVESGRPQPAQVAQDNRPIDVDAWLATLPLPDRSQRVRVRSALDDVMHGSEVARRNAAPTLAALGILAEPILVACARGSSLEVTETCLEILIQIGSTKPPALLRQLAEAPDPAFRMVAVRASRCLAAEQQKPILQRALRDPSVTIRRRALSYLAWSHPTWAMTDILRLCYDSDHTVKWAALEALVAFDPAEARERLQDLYPTMDPVLRRRAVRLLERQEKVAGVDASTRSTVEKGTNG